jgi:hypothetical protein
MKTFVIIFMLGISSIGMAQETAHTEAGHQTVTGATINVDGTLVEKKITEQELESIQAEIKKQKAETELNREKAKGFQQLSKSVEDLSETTEEYLLEKRETQKQIAEYNEKVRCMQDEYPGKECDKWLKK